MAGYGPCWQPTVVVVNPGWQPYCNGGHWVYTDCGWYWLSGYSWGWAPFHYGRWFRHSHYGLVLGSRATLGVRPGCAGDMTATIAAGRRCRRQPGYRAGVGLTYHGQHVNGSFGFGLGVNSLYVCRGQPFLRPPPEPLCPATPTRGAGLPPDGAFHHDCRQPHTGRQPRHPGVAGGSGYPHANPPGRHPRSEYPRRSQASAANGSKQTAGPCRFSDRSSRSPPGRSRHQVGARSHGPATGSAPAVGRPTSDPCAEVCGAAIPARVGPLRPNHRRERCHFCQPGPSAQFADCYREEGRQSVPNDQPECPSRDPDSAVPAHGPAAGHLLASDSDAAVPAAHDRRGGSACAARSSGPAPRAAESRVRSERPPQYTAPTYSSARPEVRGALRRRSRAAARAAHTLPQRRLLRRGRNRW